MADVWPAPMELQEFIAPCAYDRALYIRAIVLVAELGLFRRCLMKGLSIALIVMGYLAVPSAVAAAPHASEGILVDEQGMTLYVFAGKSSPDAKSCEGNCERNFPPALAASDDKPVGMLTLVPGRGGKSQWAYQGKPLYRGLMDKKPGDRSGDGLNEVWHSVPVR
ncbi:ChrI, regulatory protein, involved in Chromate resistance (plasmid) [Cupriavidus metallidurans CH34]|uniref:ChrI, regulatory protein, involved in Chromate resistance n=3 Tax=Burkholderiaceae TaxID=119060 RepID=Q1L9W3_CUPMC|nr:ChrI, regulatory protein, involved in Chromate resistance [Cupriavidus metallidurans CH34]